jgi:hypothetical protein
VQPSPNEGIPEVCTALVFLRAPFLLEVEMWSMGLVFIVSDLSFFHVSFIFKNANNIESDFIYFLYFAHITIFKIISLQFVCSAAVRPGRWLQLFNLFYCRDVCYVIFGSMEVQSTQLIASVSVSFIYFICLVFYHLPLCICLWRN